MADPFGCTTLLLLETYNMVCLFAQPVLTESVVSSKPVFNMTWGPQWQSGNTLASHL